MNESSAKAWVAGHVSRETLMRLDTCAALVRKWQRAINLVSPKSLDEIYARHIADSLQVFLLRPSDRGEWLDLGSGAGFPGMVCAIVAKEMAPDLKFTFIESDQRKAGFLREVARQTDVYAEVIAERIEVVPPRYAQIISARALAPLVKLCDLCARHLAPGGCALFPKGRTHLEERQAADQVWKMTLDVFPSKTDPEAVIYRIGDLTRV